MPRTPTRRSDAARADDLTRIDGIGQATAGWLNDAGIFTYEDLASRPAAELVQLLPEAGRVPSARPAAWRAQARKLAAGGETAAPRATAESPAGGPQETEASQHYEAFGITVSLNNDGSIRDTRMEHLRTRDVRRWAGWSPHAMLDFVTAFAAAGRPQSADGVPAVATQPDEGSQAAAPAPLAPSVLTAGLSMERTVLPAFQEFWVTVTLDLGDPMVVTERLSYSAVIEAKRLDGGIRHTLAHAEGLLATGVSPEIRLEAAGLPPGTYRLVGAVSLRRPGASQPGGLAATAEGMMLQVLAA